MSLDEVLAHAREMRFADKAESELQQMLIVCGNHAGQVGDRYATIQIEHAVKMIQDELARRQRDENQQQSAEQAGKFHQETKTELGELKTLVDRLAHPRWIDWAILIAGVIAAVATVIQLFRGN